MERVGSKPRNLVRGASAVALFAGLLALTLLFTGPLAAQETTAEQPIPQTKDKTAAAQSQYKEAANEGAKTNGGAQNTHSDNSQQQAQASSETRGGSQPAARAAGPLAKETTRVTDSDDSDLVVNRVVILEEDCTVQEGASVLVEDEDGTRVKLTDGENVSITSSEEQVVARGLQDGNLDGATAIGNSGNTKFGLTNGTEVGAVVRSTGIACGTAKADDEDSGSVKTADDLVALECEELLQRFRSAPSGQYATNRAFLDPDVEVRIEVCLEQEVIDDTETNDDLPDTGGLPLVGLAVLGLASVAAGASVIRGAGRRE